MRKLILPVIAVAAFSLSGCVSDPAAQRTVGGTNRAPSVGTAPRVNNGAVAAGPIVQRNVQTVPPSVQHSTVTQGKNAYDRGCYRYNRDGNRYWDRNC